MRVIITALLCILLTGCGFKLRGHDNKDLRLAQLHITPYKAENITHQAIRQYLLNQGVALSDEAPQLHIISYGMNDHVLAYGPKGQVRRERLTYHLTFMVEDAQGEIIVPETRVQTERDRLLNPDQSLADSHERQILEREMRYDVLGQMMQHLVL